MRKSEILNNIIRLEIKIQSNGELLKFSKEKSSATEKLAKDRNNSDFGHDGLKYMPLSLSF